MSKIIKASEFKAKCLKLLDNVSETGEEIVITKNGRPVSRLVPYRQPVTSLFGLHANVIRIEGDIVKPVEDSWEAAE